jgi:glycosyltransferase involved in cell wall biosynthesis
MAGSHQDSRLFCSLAGEPVSDSFIATDRRDLAAAAIRAANPEIAIVVTLHENAGTLRRALTSVANQRGVHGCRLVLIIDDRSRDAWREAVRECLPSGRVVVLVSRAGGAAAARNLALSLLRSSARRLRFIVRLDADDEFFDATTLRRIELAFGSSRFGPSFCHRLPVDALLASNYQRHGDDLLPRPNLAEGRLLTRAGLLERLEGMAANDPAAELPSCNLVIRPDVGGWYPAVGSGEDHWFLARLLSQPGDRVRIAGDVMHSVYSLSGSLTVSNRHSGEYLTSRRGLLRWVKAQIRGH